MKLKTLEKQKDKHNFYCGQDNERNDWVLSAGPRNNNMNYTTVILFMKTNEFPSYR